MSEFIPSTCMVSDKLQDYSQHGHSATNHNIGSLTHYFISDPVVVGIPMVPSHRRCKCRLISCCYLQFSMVFTLRIDCFNQNIVFSFFFGAFPVMIPVERSSFNSEGKPFIEKRIGVPPDTESGKETDFQGRQP